MESIDGPALLLDTFVSLSLNAVGDAQLSNVPPKHGEFQNPTPGTDPELDSQVTLRYE